MYKFLLLQLFVIIGFSSCIYKKSCNEITNKDVVGYYYSLNAKNRNKQYIQLTEDGKFINVYCDSRVTIKINGTWERTDCIVGIDGMQCFNTPMWDTAMYYKLSIYRWMDGKLFLGEDDVSYKKTRKKPKVLCNE